MSAEQIRLLPGHSPFQTPDLAGSAGGTHSASGYGLAMPASLETAPEPMEFAPACLPRLEQTRLTGSWYSRPLEDTMLTDCTLEPNERPLDLAVGSLAVGKTLSRSL